MSIVPTYYNVDPGLTPYEIALICSDTTCVAISLWGYPDCRVRITNDLISWRDATDNSALVNTSSIYSAVYAAGLDMFCVVGRDYAKSGCVLTSTDDGDTWTLQEDPGIKIQSFCWSEELQKFVAISGQSETNNISVSTDGVSWTPLQMPTTNMAIDEVPDAICWANTTNFGAIHNDSWTTTTIDYVDKAYNIFYLAWANSLGIFCALASSGSNSNQVFTSPDGINWTQRTMSSHSDWRGLCWSEELGLFCAVSTWPMVIATSPDGVTWSEQEFAGAYWKDVCWSAELTLFCAVGNNDTDAQCVATSPDGITWTLRTAIAEKFWAAVCWSADLNLFCAASGRSSSLDIMTSPDGTTWTEQTVSLGTEISQIQGITWSSELNLFCAVGAYGTHRAMTSPDGITWTAQQMPESHGYNDIVWASSIGKFCAVSSNSRTGTIATSSDGINWTTDIASGGDYYGIAWSPELHMFCAATQTDIYKVSFVTSQATTTQGKFFILTDNKHVLSSFDGIDWSYEADTAFDGADTDSFTWIDGLGKLVLSARVNTGEDYKICMSSDGITWDARTTTLLGAGTNTRGMGTKYLWNNSSQAMYAIEYQYDFNATPEWFLAGEYSTDGITFTPFDMGPNTADTRYVHRLNDNFGFFAAEVYPGGYRNLSQDGDPFELMIASLPNIYEKSCDETLLATSSICFSVASVISENISSSSDSTYWLKSNPVINEEIKSYDLIKILWQAIAEENFALSDALDKYINNIAVIVEQAKISSTIATTFVANAITTELVAIEELLNSGKGAGLDETISIDTYGTVNALMQLLLEDKVGVDSTAENTCTFQCIGLEKIIFADDLTFGGKIIAAINEGVIFSIAFNTPNDAFTGWVLNTESFAVSEYSNYPFNSFAQIAGKYYGANSNGLYLLEGDTDAGDAIEAYASLGLTNFGEPRTKRMRAAHIGIRSDGKTLLRVKTDSNDTKYYEIEESKNGLSSKKVPMQRNLLSTYWHFTLENVNGSDFELDSFEFVPVVLNRRG